jgi:hypothetical protein
MQSSPEYIPVTIEEEKKVTKGEEAHAESVH